ncbi:MAG: hypothetical protein SPJ43_01105 [Candidatus Cryptobacteroides sp.]|nr:hypothetical protein [Candidatus Cryptobacteroides sp.]
MPALPGGESDVGRSSRVIPGVKSGGRHSPAQTQGRAGDVGDIATVLPFTAVLFTSYIAKIATVRKERSSFPKTHRKEVCLQFFLPETIGIKSPKADIRSRPAAGRLSWP